MSEIAEAPDTFIHTRAGARFQAEAIRSASASVVRQKFHDIRWRGSWRRFVDLAAVRFPTSGIRSGGDGGAVGKT